MQLGVKRDLPGWKSAVSVGTRGTESKAVVENKGIFQREQPGFNIRRCG